MTGQHATRVAIVDGARTPFVKAGTVFRERAALDLACHAVDGLLERTGVDPGTIDELVWGIVVGDPRIPHLGREVVLRGPLDDRTRALTVSNNCITGLSAITAVRDAIVCGRADSGIAGGVESMSNPPVLFGRRASRIFVDLSTARTLGARLGTLARLRPGHFRPEAPGVVEPSTGLSMGQHCELMVKEWKVGRAEQDEIALASHRRAHAATEDGRLTSEIHPTGGVERDMLVRADTSSEQLARLRPVFDRTSAGTITAGNSSPLTDGAAAVLLMSESRAQAEQREVLAYLRDVEFVGIDPQDGLLMGPGLAVPRLLRRVGLALENLDLVEMHEAFAAQVLCNLRAWQDGWKEPALGALDPERLNVLGGSIAIGHPFAATGIRIATSLAHEMARRGARYGLISVCGAGATAAAMLLER